jgi:hypothetical protein
MDAGMIVGIHDTYTEALRYIKEFFELETISELNEFVEDNIIVLKIPDTEVTINLENLIKLEEMTWLLQIFQDRVKHDPKKTKL